MDPLLDWLEVYTFGARALGQNEWAIKKEPNCCMNECMTLGIWRHARMTTCTQRSRAAGDYVHICMSRVYEHTRSVPFSLSFSVFFAVSIHCIPLYVYHCIHYKKYLSVHEAQAGDLMLIAKSYLLNSPGTCNPTPRAAEWNVISAEGQCLRIFVLYNDDVSNTEQKPALIINVQSEQKSGLQINLDPRAAAL